MMAAHTATRIPSTSPLSSSAQVQRSPSYHQHSSPHRHHHPSVYYPEGVHVQQQQQRNYYQPVAITRPPPQKMEYSTDATATLSAAKVKSSAAKRASAKAAAATKKAQAAAAAAGGATSSGTSDDDSNGNDQKKTINSALSSKARAGSVSASQATSPTPGPDAKGDWVVPRRAKPGRKPSQEEPLTKRQAQNRASQRAFRERKQSHVATLEAKVAAFEAEKLTRDAKEQENQRKLLQENQLLKGTNAALTYDNTALRTRVQELEAAVEQMRLSHSSNIHAQSSAAGLSYMTTASTVASTSSSSPWTPCLDAGCRAPMHEQHLPPAQRRKRPLPSRMHEDDTTSHGGDARTAGDPSSTTTSRFGAMSIAGSTSTSPVRGAALAIPSRAPTFGMTDPFGGDNGEDDDDLGGGGSLAYLSMSNRNAPASPDFMPASGAGCGGGDMDMDRDCGFCTDATPCLCRGDAILDLTGMDDDEQGGTAPATIGVTAGVDRMIKIEEEEGEEEEEKWTGDVNMRDSSSRVKPIGAAAAIAVPSLLSSRPRESNKPKLWSVVSALSGTFTAAKPDDDGGRASGPTAKKGKLWWTQPASAQTYSTPSVTSFVPPGEKRLDEPVYVNQDGSAYVNQGGSTPGRKAWERRNSLVAAGATQAEIEAALCSGDPSNCPACATDPALAAFCEAVGEGEGEGEREEDGATSVKGSTSSAGHSVAVTLSAKKRQSDAASTTRPPLSQFNSGSTTAYNIPLSTTYRPRSTSTNTIPTLRSLDLDLSTSPADAGAVSPTVIRNRRLAAAGYSIPDAFRQIREHPGFPQWQGGLNLLADVVSGRSGGGGGGGSAVSPRTTMGLTRSADRRVMIDGDEKEEAGHSDEGGLSSLHLPSLLPSSSAARTETTAAAATTSNSTSGSSHLKRRRLYVENDRVQEALRMLDFGAVSGGSSSTASARRLPLPLPRVPPSSLAYGRGSQSSADRRDAPCMECPCPCPWAQGGSGGNESEEPHGESSSQDENK